MLYNCPTCNEECELQGDSIEELSCWCDKCDEEIIGKLDDVYSDWDSSQIDRAQDFFEDR